MAVVYRRVKKCGRKVDLVILHMDIVHLAAVCHSAPLASATSSRPNLQIVNLDELIPIGETLKEGFDGQWIWHSLTAFDSNMTDFIYLHWREGIRIWRECHLLVLLIGCHFLLELSFEGLKLFNLQVQPGNSNETMWFQLLWASQRHVSCNLQMVNWMDWWR